jgi:hypothetical protein
VSFALWPEFCSVFTFQLGCFTQKPGGCSVFLWQPGRYSQFTMWPGCCRTLTLHPEVEVHFPHGWNVEVFLYLAAWISRCVTYVLGLTVCLARCLGLSQCVAMHFPWGLSIQCVFLMARMLQCIYDTAWML